MISYFKSLRLDRKVALKEASYYRSNPFFTRVDKQLNLKYLLKNPYRVASRFLKKQGASDPYVYGETPLFTLDRLAKKMELSANDTILELGAGRGRSLLFFHTFYGAKGVGYEWVPLFCRRANKLFSRHSLPIKLKNKPLLEMKAEDASVAYLYGCTFSDPLLFKLAEKLAHMKSLRKVICISFPISDYAPIATFSEAKRVPVLFPWGRTMAYIQDKL